jgi:hypothetical protein
LIATVFALLVGLALLDGAFSGFRASLGRSGLVDHAASDREGALHGTRLVATMAIPGLLAFALDLTAGNQSASSYAEAGLIFLSLLAPYAILVILALVGYAVTGWRRRYLASALILGPFTLFRPYYVLAAATVTVLRVSDLSVTSTAVLAVAAVLLVEPIANLRYGTAAKAA